MNRELLKIQQGTIYDFKTVKYVYDRCLNYENVTKLLDYCCKMNLSPYVWISNLSILNININEWAVSIGVE